MCSCSRCGEPTAMLHTKLCDECWELERRIARQPAVARQILKVDELEEEMEAMVSLHNDQVRELEAEVEEWQDKWRWEREHGCPHWGHHTSDGREAVCWYDCPDALKKAEAELAECQFQAATKSDKDRIGMLEAEVERLRGRRCEGCRFYDDTTRFCSVFTTHWPPDFGCNRWEVRGNEAD